MRADVALIVLADRPLALPVLLACLRAQTFTSWECIVLDQSDGDQIAGIVTAQQDSRIWRVPVPRRGDWGQTEKARAAVEITDAEFVAFPNDDAYYAPVFLEWMLQAAAEGQLDLVYCNWIFDKFRYAPMAVRPAVGHIDVGGFLVRRDALIEVGWTDTGQTGDGVLVQSLVRAGKRHGRVDSVLYVKN